MLKEKSQHIKYLQAELTNIKNDLTNTISSLAGTVFVQMLVDCANMLNVSKCH